MRLLLAGVGVLALTLSSGAASAQYMIVPNGPNGSIMLPPGAGQTSGYGNSVNPGPTFIIPNYPPPQIVTPQNWQQFKPGYRGF
jgi:hypothetical protein